MAWMRAIAGVKREGDNDKMDKVYLDSSPQEFQCGEQQKQGM